MRLLVVFILIGSGVFAQQPYFQQAVRYDIDVRLDDTRHVLHGNLTLGYTNQAPVALDSIVFHLWPRAYSSGNTAFARQQLRNGSTRFHFSEDGERGTLDSLDFRVDGAAAAFRFTGDPDIGVLYLSEALAPNTTVTITTPFRVKIPASFSRLGHVRESYQATQWYPKPAVYDRDGWHAMPYVDQGEFYSEFGDFRVRITLPENYVVAATGVLQETAERDWLLARADSTASSLAARTDLPTGLVDEPFPPSAAREKTITYRAEQVHDFAWFADKRFAVLHDTLHLSLRRGPLPPPTQPDDVVDVWSFFTETEIGLWKNSLTYLKRATRFYSEHVGVYPYPQVTGVQSALSAGGGMEYPMITVIDRAYTPYGLDGVLTHEVGHNWFYSILGSNERDRAWMDEGLNSYYEGRYLRTYYPNRSGLSDYIPGRKVDLDRLASRYTARLGTAQPPETPSSELSQYNYWIAAYSKPDLALQALAAKRGSARVDADLQRYYAEWRFRHPSPTDFYAAVDSADFLRQAIETTDAGEYNRDLLRNPATEGFTVSLVTDQEKARTQLFVAPLLGFNANDGFLAGLALHNRTLEPRRIEWMLAPLYGFESKELAGFAGARYRLTSPAPWLQRVVVSAGIQQFSDLRPTAQRLDSLGLVYGYRRTAVKSEFFLRHPTETQRRSSMYTQFVNLRQQRPAFSNVGELLPEADVVTTNFLALGYTATLDRTINPVGYGAKLEYRDGEKDNFQDPRSLRLEATLTGGYQYRPDAFIRWRLFGGYFLLHDNRERTTSPSTSFSLVDNADSDYRYDDLYFGRNRSGGYQQQLDRRQGGFRAPIDGAFPYGRSNDYLGALNLDADLPIPLPIGLFFDLGAYGFRPTTSSPQTTELNYVAGLSINILQDRLHLYLPLVTDADTRTLLEQRGNLLDRMSLRLNLRELLPFRWIDEVAR